MNADVRQQWTAALRSGEYAQGRGGLAYEDESGVRRFCCLGVLCDLAVRAGVPVAVTREMNALEYTQYDKCAGFLPPSVMRWAGLASDNPKIGGVTLSFLNDGATPFTVIADRIEEAL